MNNTKSYMIYISNFGKKIEILPKFDFLFRPICSFKWLGTRRSYTYISMFCIKIIRFNLIILIQNEKKLCNEFYFSLFCSVIIRLNLINAIQNDENHIL